MNSLSKEMPSSLIFFSKIDVSKLIVTVKKLSILENGSFFSSRKNRDVSNHLFPLFLPLAFSKLYLENEIIK